VRTTSLICSPWYTCPTSIMFQALADKTQMHNNQSVLSVPLIKGCRMHDPKVPTEFVVGTCLEPFLAYLSHECMPSAKTVHESAELRIRATRDIAAGEEITMCYAPEIRDYQTRKSDLKTYWVIDRNCLLCQKGDFGPQGPLRDQVRALKNIDLAQYPNRLGEVKRAIQAKARCWLRMGS